MGKGEKFHSLEMSTYTVFHILMKEEGNPTRQMYEISQELNE